MTREDAREFALQWLPAWTGNKPEELAACYSEDAYDCDPGIHNGVKGNEVYFDRTELVKEISKARKPAT